MLNDQAGHVPCPLVPCPSVCLVARSKQEERLRGKELEMQVERSHLPKRGGLHLGPLFVEKAIGQTAQWQELSGAQRHPLSASWSRGGCHQTPEGSCHFDTTNAENNSKQHH